MNLGESRATWSGSTSLPRRRRRQINETSRGALDATGHDEETWRKDRRVDIDLVK